MPRKPSSIYLIVEQPANASRPGPGMQPQPPTNLHVWRVPLQDGEEPEAAAKRGYEDHPIGSTVAYVEDTKVRAYRVGLTLSEIDDPRIDPEDEEPPPTP